MPETKNKPRQLSSLQQRVITALIVAPIGIALIVMLPISGLWWLCAALIGTAAYEWLQFASISGRPIRWFVGISVAAAIGLAASQLPETVGRPLGLAGLLVWSFAAAWLANASWGASPALPYRLLKLTLGALILGLAASCLGLLFASQSGRGWFLLLLLFIWAADIGAYFTGKAVGRTKLAPTVSPNKTWEGVAGGMVLNGLVGVVAGLTWLKLSGTPLLLLILLGVVTGAISIIGDLFISMLKRHVGLKDAGRLLPGHGGVLDRFDSLLAAAPAFLFGRLLFGL